jgi:Zn-dependent protease
MLAIAGAPVFGGAKPVPFNPNNLKFGEWGVAIVALAGPLTNFFIAFFTIGIWVIIGAPIQGIVGQIFITTASVNLGFFVFNMIPIPPLDGSRVLYALAPEFVRRGMESMEKFGILIVFLIMLLTGTALEFFMSSSINFFLNVFSRIFGM